MNDRRLRVNAPQVVSNGVDGVVMVVNLETGSYYELAEVGADVWMSIESGLSLGECVDVVLSRYEADRGTVADALGEFVDALETEGLVSPAETGVAGQAAGPPPDAVRPRRSFRPPTLEPYLDLQTLIKLDPIFEQDEQGWPSVDTTP